MIRPLVQDARIRHHAIANNIQSANVGVLWKRADEIPLLPVYFDLNSGVAAIRWNKMLR
jgi:hypothetical protein